MKVYAPKVTAHTRKPPLIRADKHKTNVRFINMATTKTSIVTTITKLYNTGNNNGSLSSIPYHLGSSSSLFSSSAAAASSVTESQSAISSQATEKERSGWSWSYYLWSWDLADCQKARQEMLEYRRKRFGMEPLKFNSVSPSSEELENLEFRRVLCRGHIDEKRSIYVGPRSKSISGVTENGYYVITPLLPISDKAESSQPPILVNRGWVPRCWKEKSSELPQDDEQPSNTMPTFGKEEERASWWRSWTKKPKVVEDQPPTRTPDEVVGVIRGSEKPSIFVPPNDPTSGQWFYVDVSAIARTCGLPEDTIYIEDIREDVNPSNPYPLPKDGSTLFRSSVMPQDHLNYTLTWYSLSAAVTFMAFMRLRPKKIRRSDIRTSIRAS